MPDNVVAPGRGAVLVTDEIAGVHWPVTKLAIGAENVATLVSEESPLPVLVEGGATEAGLSAIAAKLPTLGQKAQSGSVSIVPATGATFPIAGVAYADVSIASLSAGQAAGTATVLAANANRKSLMINPPADCFLAIGSGATGGYPLFADVPNQITGQDCPTNALYIGGLSAAASVVIWEA